MSETKRFRDQHDRMLTLVSEISAHLNVDELSHDTTEVKRLLLILLGKLSVHLTMEDKALYPRLLEHPDEKIKAIANRFIDDMGSIGEAVEDYKSKWLPASNIQKESALFIEHTKGIFEALKNRIEKENNELYKTLDES